MFDGNTNAFDVKENRLTPALVGRWVRLYPINFYDYPSLQWELYGELSTTFAEVQEISYSKPTVESVISAEEDLKYRLK